MRIFKRIFATVHQSNSTLFLAHWLYFQLKITENIYSQVELNSNELATKFFLNFEYKHFETVDI